MLIIAVGIAISLLMITWINRSERQNRINRRERWRKFWKRDDVWGDDD